MGYQAVQYPDKPVSAVLPLTMDFADRLMDGETITGVTCSNSIFSGTDASPGAMLIGSTSFSGTVATQSFGAGVVGVIYNLIFFASTSAFNLYQKTGYVAVISDSNPY